MAALFLTVVALSAIFGRRCWRSCADLPQPERTLVPALVGLMAGSAGSFTIFLTATTLLA